MRQSGLRMSHNYIDAHTHLIHEKFEGPGVIESVINKCSVNGLDKIVVNGLEPKSNRAILELCAKYPEMLVPALGIYPLDACAKSIQANRAVWTHDFDPPEVFDIDAEIAFIEQMAAQKKIIAVGECGLDKHYVTEATCMNEQEDVLRKLMKVAKKHDMPLILHTRKAEARVLEMLIEEGVTKADFHCFCGKPKLGVKIAEAGYYLSIPSIVERSDSFQKLVSVLPMDYILTETDAPYMGPDKGERNDPSTIPRGVAAIAKVKGIPTEAAASHIRTNFQRLFGI